MAGKHQWWQRCNEKRGEKKQQQKTPQSTYETHVKQSKAWIIRVPKEDGREKEIWRNMAITNLMKTIHPQIQESKRTSSKRKKKQKEKYTKGYHTCNQITQKEW